MRRKNGVKINERRSRMLAMRKNSRNKETEIDHILRCKTAREKAEAYARLLWECRTIPDGTNRILKVTDLINRRSINTPRYGGELHIFREVGDPIAIRFSDIINRLRSRYDRNKRWWRKKHLAEETNNPNGFVSELTRLLEKVK